MEHKVEIIILIKCCQRPKTTTTLSEFVCKSSGLSDVVVVGRWAAHLVACVVRLINI